ncbi:PA2779 family protein [Catenovulum sp. 2E275]|uniref:PA2779 family protein n=1 Tax=Catenovulum sp. 2E275 TaxID=2980497 RepID=UPI0021D1D6CC|nr:PA2779 family protein [Catenovulum sp. 2E275]MCU4677272.1 PA2779 family protein [Catenovulum sp. 2E275]
MKSFVKAGIASCLFVLGAGQATAGLVDSNQVIQQQEYQFNKAQVLSFVDSEQVQAKLIELGIQPEDAKNRIANMTSEELASLNQQINEAPAASGIVGTIITVMVVVAVLDVMGITDVYPFIRPL